jgi:hypothetical protein
MTWKDENERIRLARLLDEACDLLSTFGKVDPVTEEPNQPVVQFLESDELREAQR